jgi:hypothetical protein
VEREQGMQLKTPAADRFQQAAINQDAHGRSRIVEIPGDSHCLQIEGGRFRGKQSQIGETLAHLRIKRIGAAFKQGGNGRCGIAPGTNHIAWCLRCQESRAFAQFGKQFAHPPAEACFILEQPSCNLNGKR